MNNAQRRLITAGYAGLPFGEFSKCEAGDVGVLGVPSEVDGGPRSGTFLAPDALRRMSGQLETILPARLSDCDSDRCARSRLQGLRCSTYQDSLPVGRARLQEDGVLSASG